MKRSIDVAFIMTMLSVGALLVFCINALADYMP